MALWSREQNLLTVKGKEILSKLQAGIGKMEITRIVSGAGYVSAFDIEYQTDVTDPRLEFTIIAKETSREGSGLEIQLSNMGLSDPYLLYQIGVYVTHTDYVDGDGELVEQLYMLAQSSTSHPDEVTAFSDMPMELNYSIYLYHSNVADPSQITINVSMAGYIPLHMRGRSLGIAPLNLNGVVPLEHLSPATYFERGVVQFASELEVMTGDVDNKAVTPFELQKYVSYALVESGFTPIDHADPTPVYGQASITDYGHIQISDDLDITTGTDTKKAVTPAQIKAVRVNLQNQIDDIVSDAGDMEDEISGIKTSITSINTSITGINTSITTLNGKFTNNTVANAAGDFEVSKYLRWRVNGNNHVIFDASNSLAPNGSTAINNTNATNPWQATYPTIMGWNGTQTYGVRVDKARDADTLTNLAPSSSTLAVAANQIVRTDASGYVKFTYINTNVTVENPAIGAFFVQNNSADGYIRKADTATVISTLRTSGLVGIPTGGSAGQVLSKNSAMDRDVAWVSPGSSLPMGGTTGQALLKNSNTNYDVGWGAVQSLPTGGSTGQVLRKNSATNYDVGWAAATAVYQ